MQSQSANQKRAPQSECNLHILQLNCTEIRPKWAHTNQLIDSFANKKVGKP